MNPTNKRPRSDAPTVVLHWSLVLTLLLSLASGLRIMADRADATLARALRPVLLQGPVIDWHVLSAFALTALIFAYVIYLRRARLASRVALNLRAIAARDRATRWTAINRILYWIAFGLVVAAAITGGLLYFAPGLLPRRGVIAVHQAAAWAILAYVAAHVLAQLALGGVPQLLKIVTPRAAYGGAAALAVSASVVTLGAVIYPSSRAAIRPLPIAFTHAAPAIDGNPDDTAWSRAKAVDIPTNDGVNLEGGEVTVRVRGLRDNGHAYLLFEWRDATRSQKHLPLVKTADGWQLMEKRYAMNDENDYYEDKFAVMLSRSSKMGGGATHLGHKPLGDKPAPAHGRGLHYTTDGSYVDVWHWKSVRTGPLGQMDDNFFGPPLRTPDKADARYTGGYTQDPKTAGGFAENWTKIDGGKFIEPRRLPRDPARLQASMGRVNLDPSVGDEGQWSMDLADTVEYAKALDTYPVGTVLPSVLIDRPFEGDRGDVTAFATWKDGWWRLEVKRKLDTQSRFDAPIAEGVFLWVAVFDHNQARHTRHVHPVRITLEN